MLERFLSCTCLAQRCTGGAQDLPQLGEDKSVETLNGCGLGWNSKNLSQVHEGVPRQAEGIIPPGVPGFDPAFKGLDYDPEKARKLLAQAGYPGGQGFPPLKLAFRASFEETVG